MSDDIIEVTKPSGYLFAGDRPSQYRVTCEQCGTPNRDGIRMHSKLSKKHLRRVGLDPDEVEGTLLRCNNCHQIRRF